MIEIGSAAPKLRGALTIIRYRVNRLYCNMGHTIESYCIAGLAHWVCPSCFGVSILHESNEGWRERSGTTLVRQPMARATPAPKRHSGVPLGRGRTGVVGSIAAGLPVPRSSLVRRLRQSTDFFGRYADGKSPLSVAN